MRVISWSICSFAYLATLFILPVRSFSQSTDYLNLVSLQGDTISLEGFDIEGYRAVSLATIEQMDWEIELNNESLRALISDTDSVEFFFDSPFFRWNDEILQLVDAPSLEGMSAYIPLQFFVDFIPVRLPDKYFVSNGQFPITDEMVNIEREPVIDLDPQMDSVEDGDIDERRLVIIDPGHGGQDPGTIGSGGRREKDIALSVSRELVRELGRDEDIEVHMTRDRDVFVPLWERGEQAMVWKGDRPAIFLSIHVNAAPNSPSVRGFETYFLSEARNEHEKRVAANENAPLRLYSGEDDDENPDLDFILRELRNLDHQHWSASLAETIQGQLRTVHSGPDRGVKQGPFAVITNVLMPAVLVEIGFVSNREEEREMSRSEFQKGLGRALADAVRSFYDRYPPGRETVGKSRNN